MTEIALFPIPDCTTFPGTSFPLHVFEPRYRAMVKACVDDDRLMGICHTEALISAPKRNQTVEQTLKSNQATYRPFDIFSAGKVEIQESLADGRILINVNLIDRFRLVKAVQSVPYSIYECDYYVDRPISENDQVMANELKKRILLKLDLVTEEHPEINALLHTKEWETMSATDFSFKMFGIIRTQGDLLQQVLQCRSPLERLNLAAQILALKPA